MKLSAVRQERLPRLAWLAAIDFHQNLTEVFHGSRVEVHNDFIVEGVWDGPFNRGAFASTENFFGSGLQLVEGQIVVSPSRALVDRVFSCPTATGHLVSNSLPLLMFASGARLDLSRTYHQETYTMLEGITDYDSRFAVLPETVGPIQQHYYHPFEVLPDGLRRRSAPDPPQFSNFDGYISFLRLILDALLRNASAADRAHPFVSRLTISRGYDSPAVATLVSRFIKPPAYTAARSNSLLPSWLDHEATFDDGTCIAESLGLPVHKLQAGPPTLDERLFFAGGTGDPELIFSTLASDALSDPHPTLFFSGYHGDKVWAKDPGRAYVTPEIRRGDTSGLALSEVRLWAGFVNLPVPFIGARGIESITRITQSAEMSAWSVGGEYDRPIPRRIVEEAGIPREWFGQRKRAVLQTHPLPLSPSLRPVFGRWLKDRLGISPERYRVLVWAGLCRWSFLRVMEKASTRIGIKMAEPMRWRWVPGGGPASLLYRWAVSELADPEGDAFPPDVSVADQTDNRELS